jgi:hypothetical protein
MLCAPSRGGDGFCIVAKLRDVGWGTLRRHVAADEQRASAGACGRSGRKGIPPSPAGGRLGGRGDANPPIWTFVNANRQAKGGAVEMVAATRLAHWLGDIGDRFSPLRQAFLLFCRFATGAGATAKKALYG